MIPLNKPKYHPEAFENVQRVLKSGWTGLGPETAKFEEEFAEYLGAKYVVALSSGTEALRLAVAVAEPPYNSTVITTPNTFVSTNHVLRQHGLMPYFADIDPETGSISLDSVHHILRARRQYISIVMLVHYGGMPVDIEKFRSLARYYKAIIIEDCAHACGAVYKDQLVGATGTYNCFSFQAVKNLSTGDGGAISTDDEEVYTALRKMRWLGIDKSTIDRINEDKYSWEYDCPTLGYKSHMNDITAAIARGQLLHLDEDNAYRHTLVSRYHSNLLSIPEVILLKNNMISQSSNHLFVVRFKNSVVRDHVILALKKAEINYGYHYKPNYLYKPYTYCDIESRLGMDTFYYTALTLPLHLYMTQKDVDYICEVIGNGIRAYHGKI
jgi:perosamine synthetase